MTPILKIRSAVQTNNIGDYDGDLQSEFEHTSKKNVLKIEIEDIQGEIDFWRSVIVCYVLGVNPQISVMEGYVRRMWKNMGVDKVPILARVVFIVRFHTVENRDKILKGGIPFFDSKPVIVKALDPDTDFVKEDVRCVPIWVQLRNLDFNYWGERCLYKIVNQIGKPVNVDQTTSRRDKLHFSRILIEVVVSQEFSNTISFVNEKDREVVVNVNYEWKPTHCMVCNGIGQEVNVCKRGLGRRIWVPKQVQKQQPLAPPTPLVVPTPPLNQEDGVFLVVKTGTRRVVHPPALTVLSNGFQLLITDPILAREAYDADNVVNVEDTGGGGVPPRQYG